MAWTPTSVAGCKLWIEARRIVANDGDAISSITDLSGTGTSVTATGTAKPLFKANIVNGTPALLFDGTDDRLSVGSFALGTLVIAAYYTAATFGAYDGLWAEDVAGNSPFYLIGNGAGGSADFYTASPFPATATIYKDGVAASTAVTNAWHVFSVTDTVPLTSAWVIGQDRQQAARFWHGYVTCAFAYDTVLSAANLTQAYQYAQSQISRSALLSTGNFHLARGSVALSTGNFATAIR